MPYDAPPNDRTFTLRRLMLVVTWLAGSFALLHYLERVAPQWARLLAIGTIAIGVFTLLIGVLTRVLDDWQSSTKPEESAAIVVGLLALLVIALIGLALALSAAV